MVDSVTLFKRIAEMWCYLGVYSLVILTFSYFDAEASTQKLQAQLVTAVRMISEIRLGDHRSYFNCAQFNEVRKFQETSENPIDPNLNEIMMERLILQQSMLQDCSQIYDHGYQTSGIYPLWLQQGYRYSLFYCDMDTMSELTNKRGWTVIQRRINGEVNFERKWNQYVKGFGKLEGEHWIGLENIHSITRQLPFSTYWISSWNAPRLRIDFEDWDGIQAYSEIDKFLVSALEWRYDIHQFRNVSGTAQGPGSWGSLQEAKFSTIDNDSTGKNCPQRYRGGWWFPSDCGRSNLNGPYPKQKNAMGMNNIYWWTWYAANEREAALSRVSMKIQY